MVLCDTDWDINWCKISPIFRIVGPNGQNLTWRISSTNIVILQYPRPQIPLRSARSRACRFHLDTKSSPWASCWHRATRASELVPYLQPMGSCTFPSCGIYMGETQGEEADHHAYSTAAIRGLVFQASTGSLSKSQLLCFMWSPPWHVKTYLHIF